MLTKKELMKKMDIKKDKVIKSNIIAVLTKIVSNDSNKGWKLVDKNGKEIKVGDTITFEGNQVKVTSLEPPHKPGANGRVSTKNATKNWTDRFYADVYGLKFVRESDATAGLKIVAEAIKVKKGTKIEVDTYKVSQWPERIVSTGEIVEDTVVKDKSTKILCYLKKCQGNFFVPASEIFLVDDGRYLCESDATARLKKWKKFEKVIIASEKTYKIVRFYQNINHPKEVLETGLSFEEAQEHCNDPETSSSTCEKPENIARTEEMGDWFDGYYEE